MSAALTCRRARVSAPRCRDRERADVGAGRSTATSSPRTRWSTSSTARKEQLRQGGHRELQPAERRARAVSHALDANGGLRDRTHEVVRVPRSSTTTRATSTSRAATSSSACWLCSPMSSSPRKRVAAQGRVASPCSLAIVMARSSASSVTGVRDGRAADDAAWQFAEQCVWEAIRT